MRNTLTTTLALAALALPLAACSTASSSADPAPSREGGLFTKSINVCFESETREYGLIDHFKPNLGYPVNPKQNWCGPGREAGTYGFLFDVKAGSGETVVFHLANPGVGRPNVDAQIKASSNAFGDGTPFDVGQHSTFDIGGYIFDVERQPDTDVKNFRIVMK